MIQDIFILPLTLSQLSCISRFCKTIFFKTVTFIYFNGRVSTHPSIFRTEFLRSCSLDFSVTGYSDDKTTFTFIRINFPMLYLHLTCSVLSARNYHRYRLRQTQTARALHCSVFFWVFFKESSSWWTFRKSQLSRAAALWFAWGLHGQHNNGWRGYCSQNSTEVSTWVSLAWDSP